MTSSLLFDGKHLRVSVLGNDPDRLIVTYDHWGADKAGFAPLKPRSAHSDRGYTHLHLATGQSDWFLNDDLPEVLDLVGRFAQAFPRKVTLAFSMGGFAALLLSRSIAFDNVMLVSPHSTFSPEYPPHDDRFVSKGVSQEVAAMAYDLLLNGPKSPADCVVLYDSLAPFDAAHAASAAGLFRNARLVDLKGGGHPATKRITNNGGFTLVQKAVMAETIDPAPILKRHLWLKKQTGKA